MTQKETVKDTIKKLFSDDLFDFVAVGEMQFDRDDFVSVESAECGDDELVTLKMRNCIATFYASSIRYTCKARELSRSRFMYLMENKDVDTLIIYYDKDSGIPTTVINKKDVVSVSKSEHNGMTTIVKTRTGEQQIRFGCINAIDASYKVTKREGKENTSKEN